MLAIIKRLLQNSNSKIGLIKMKLTKFFSHRSVLLLLICGIIFLGGIIFYGFIYLMMSPAAKWFVFGVFVYFILYTIIDILSTHFDNMILKKANRALDYTLIPILFFIKIIRPCVFLIFGFLFLILVGYILPWGILKGLGSIFTWDLEHETIWFIVLTLGSIFSVYLAKSLFSLSNRIAFPDSCEKNDYRAVGLDLVKYLLHPKNLIFVMYLLYFCFMSVSGIMQFQHLEFLVNESVDAAILKSFLVFIAFSNLINKGQDLDVESKELFIRITTLINTD